MKRPGGIDLEQGRVELRHGSGGRASSNLVDAIFRPCFYDSSRDGQDDFALLGAVDGRLAVSTDAHVISPLFFPGGDIGSLAVNGTLNDVAMSGAQPLHLTAAFVLEEGLPLSDLERIAVSMGDAARAAGVSIVAGDTKVVEQGKGDGVFVTTTGIGVVPAGLELSCERARVGDAVLVSGPIGDHGIAVMAARGGLGLETDLVSDTAALHPLVAAMVAAVPAVRCLRDATRGGLGTVLNEVAWASGVGMRLEEPAIPVRKQVQAVCEVLGIDPLYVANEGKLVAICPTEEARRLLDVMRGHPLGRGAAVIGEVVADPGRFVEMKTTLGGTRIVRWLDSDPLPRIC